jgi:hypothetical protein
VNHEDPIFSSRLDFFGYDLKRLFSTANANANAIASTCSEYNAGSCGRSAVERFVAICSS